MLYDDICRPLNPDVVVWHWASNDPINNDYVADYSSGPNNVRPRPCFENGQIVMRKAYPIRLHNTLDYTVTMKVINGLMLKWFRASPEEVAPHIEDGWKVAKQMLRRVAEGPGAKIALVGKHETRATQMFAAAGYEIASYPRFQPNQTCAPRDSHPNKSGHLHMLEYLEPVVRRALELDELRSDSRVPN